MQRYFKTGPGEYGEGDVFLGVRVPQVRAVAKGFADLPVDQIDVLLDSAFHEHRFAALVVLVTRYARARDDDTRRAVVDHYVEAVLRGRVDNWDLVDTSAHAILGEWLVDRRRDLVFTLAADPDLWRRRVALLATFAFVKHGDASTTLEVAARVLDDRRDLTQKATGWMLREVGKRVDRAALTGFLDTHAAHRGRTALGYATEHLTPAERAHYRSLT
ncbi:DNA alkylation repair protein [Rhodococcus sp. HNM0569]|nr:DNA alkylation repair protein [Rhodococcus sp. HNM0569]